MKTKLPTYNQLMNPLLRVSMALGESGSTEAICDKVEKTREWFERNPALYVLSRKKTRNVGEVRRGFGTELYPSQDTKMSAWNSSTSMVKASTLGGVKNNMPPALPGKSGAHNLGISLSKVNYVGSKAATTQKVSTNTGRQASHMSLGSTWHPVQTNVGLSESQQYLNRPHDDSAKTRSLDHLQSNVVLIVDKDQMSGISHRKNRRSIMGKVLLEIDSSFAGELGIGTQLFPDQIEIIPTDRFDGGDQNIQALVALGLGVIPFLSKIIIEAIRARKHVVIKKNGIQIKGLDHKNALKVLREISDED